MTNEGETEKKKKIADESRTYAMDMNRFASISRLHVSFHKPLERQFKGTRRFFGLSLTLSYLLQ